MNYIRVREAAELLAVSEQTVRKLAKCCDLESVRIGKRAVRISAESVEAYLRSNAAGDRRT